MISTKLTRAIFLMGLLNWLPSCTTPDYGKQVEEAELAFAQMAKDSGVAVAFREFAADDAVLSRGGKVLEGRSEFWEFYDRPQFDKSIYTLDWKPEYVRASEDGSLGYTFGPFTWSRADSLGKIKEGEGVFHTVWARQKDGSWKFVYD